MEKFKKTSLVILISSIILAFMTMLLLKEDKDVSKFERRKLMKKPNFTVKKVFDKRYFPNYEKYLLDQFPLRDEMRKIKSFSSFKILSKKDNNKVFYIRNNIFKLDKEFNKKQIELAVRRINYIINNHPEANSYYYSIIPDKSHFVSNIPKINVDEMENLLSEKIENAKYIDITKLLELDDYYKTDPHWSSEKIEKVAKKISESTNGFFYPIKEAKKEKLENFYGAYYGQLALDFPSENIAYFDSPSFDSLTITGIDKNEVIKMYDKDAFSSVDPYDFFLGGAKPLIFIENPSVKNDKEIIIFRDSFGSSLAPLLVNSYKKITLVDIRYISSKNIEKLITFNKSDVLFIYSTALWNNGGILK